MSFSIAPRHRLPSPPERPFQWCTVMMAAPCCGTKLQSPGLACPVPSPIKSTSVGIAAEQVALFRYILLDTVVPLPRPREFCPDECAI